MRYDEPCSRSAVSRGQLPVPGLERAIGFKSLADAIWLRNHVIETLEAANADEDPAHRNEQLTYLFVGAGYAGVEALAELQDFAVDAMDRYPRARLHGMNWILVEAQDRILPETDADLAEYAMRELRGRGIEVRLGTRLDELTGDDGSAVDRGDVSHPHRGVDDRRRAAPEPAIVERAARRQRPRPGRRDDARRGLDAVWAVGDCAAVLNATGGISPVTAQFAIRQGRTVGRNVAAALGWAAPARSRTGTRARS